MKKILITGSAGFIGSNLAEYLLEQGEFVVGVDNFITGSRENLKDLRSAPNFTFIEAAVEDPSLKGKLTGFKFDEIYHLACPTGVPNLVTLAEEMLSATSFGTKNVLDIALASKARFLFTSSSEVYGDPLVFPQGEEYTGNVDPVGLRSSYEEGKRFAESLTAMYVRKHKVDARIVRVFNTYGPNMSYKDQRVIPVFLNAIETGKPLPIHGDGTQKRTFCHVDDLINGLVLAMRKGGPGEVYNLGSDKEVTVLKLATTLARLADTDVKLSFLPRPSHDHQARRPKLTKIKALGWSPKISLEEGLARTLKLPHSATIKV
ncbi:MAG: dTDP-glucose 4,6-dehydratase [Candidatus Woesebacteria bacterium GW2011_GWA1_45_8]|uniref:dTDP-glucose 4,6-dehydratase n=1 Tax=Candidatus Woesebacteria bacterium GW2011_GWA1_45_8 TaxID=1618559 RepID=A0A0G1QTU7_9BACT|nr:MAG: dTDP-glucose 4,6-dehydratase [Candidatus Woesebacteria bacterium GW2011_GWA1_45_8]